MARKIKKEPNTGKMASIADEPASCSDVEMTNSSTADSQALKATANIRSDRRESSGSQHSSETLPPDPDNGLNILGRGVKELVQAVQKLRHLGIEDLGLPLPKIVVVGDQSTGKSSLIEGMSEIKVPRNAGTCTRCPLEINLAESTHPGERWRCKISLFKKYVYLGAHGFSGASSGRAGHIRSEGATRARPLGPWDPQSFEDFHFANITSKAEVAKALKLAQLATLNPGKDYERYLPGKADPGPDIQVKFSPNGVRLDITGPGLPNMSFYDLPGVISVSETEEEQYLVDLVTNLVKEYIKDDSCINLLALTMTDDPANSTASDLIRKVKAEARTVGVLTKPDRVQQGESFDQWVQMLSDQRFRLGFGYHVIKNNPDPTVDNATARAEEKHFFDTEQPWATSLNRYSDRFGTLQLQTFLSHKLTAQIKASLPRITEQVQNKADAIMEKLQLLPQPTAGNLPIKIRESLFGFESAIRDHVDGGIREYPFQKGWKNLALEFWGIMTESRPILQMRAETVNSSGGTPTSVRHPQPEPISLDSDDEKCAVEAPNSRKRPAREAKVTPSKRRIIDIPPFTPERSSTRPSGPSRPFAATFSLRGISDIIQDAPTTFLTDVDPRARDRMIKMSQQSWEKPLDQFLDRTENLCKEMVLEQVSSSFGCWRQTPLYSLIEETCVSFLESVMADQRSMARKALQLELYRPIAFDSQALIQAQDRARLDVNSRRRDYLAGCHLRKIFQKNNKPVEASGWEEKVAKVNDEDLGPDPFSREVSLMGEVRGYYDYASSRFVDVICQGIQGELFVKCRNELGIMLNEQIGIMKPNADDRCATLLEIDIEDRERRVQLEKEKAVIREAQDWLEGLTKDVPDTVSGLS